MKISSRSRMKSKAGFNLIGMMIAIVIAGILTVAVVPDIRNAIFRAQDTKAAQLQDDLNTWYSNWTHSGGIHNSTTTNQGDMANYLLQVASGPTSDAGTARRSGEVWVDETRLKIRGKSNCGAIRIELKKEFSVSGTTVIFDNDYTVTFDPKGTPNKGEFTVGVLSQ